MQNFQQTDGITGSRDIAMAFYNVFTRIGVSIQSQQGSGCTSRHGQRRTWQGIYSESPVTMCQTSENGQEM